ncbi:hypothetical protein AMS68_002025 [Peltaster fructicola]|uniref:Uncharacterized protein n=1 Tax=Peltaster fructicola TaxID=286661 RepID=A0A6H0XPF0_9PEZI|nr:hypothetical protein AMS68_002025 [Peltaster fructicola]
MAKAKASADPLAQSRPKLDFMRKLGLDVSSMSHQQAEAEKSRRSVNFDRDALLPHLKQNPYIQPPFTRSQISAAAHQRQVLDLYQNASPTTLLYYDRAHDSSTGRNWAIEWLLWHIFKSRNPRRRAGFKHAVYEALVKHMSQVDRQSSMPLDGLFGTTSLQAASQGRHAEPKDLARQLRFDPIRDL